MPQSERRTRKPACLGADQPQIRLPSTQGRTGELLRAGHVPVHTMAELTKPKPTPLSPFFSQGSCRFTQQLCPLPLRPAEQPTSFAMKSDCRRNERRRESFRLMASLDVTLLARIAAAWSMSVPLPIRVCHSASSWTRNAVQDRRDAGSTVGRVIESAAFSAQARHTGLFRHSTTAAACLTCS